MRESLRCRLLALQKVRFTRILLLRIHFFIIYFLLKIFRELKNHYKVNLKRPVEGKKKMEKVDFDEVVDGSILRKLEDAFFLTSALGVSEEVKAKTWDRTFGSLVTSHLLDEGDVARVRAVKAVLSYFADTVKRSSVQKSTSILESLHPHNLRFWTKRTYCKTNFELYNSFSVLSWNRVSALPQHLYSQFNHKSK